jgi:uroporphyrinogen III methyltransferase/synthase
VADGGLPTGAGAAVPGCAYLVGAGPGDPELITVRGAELLASAEVVLHDELVHPSLLDLVRADAIVRAVGKRGGHPAAKQAKQAEIDAELVRWAREGKSVVRLKGGDPFLFGRGSEEAEALAAAGIVFEVVPGVPSPLGASAYAGISLTHRDLASSVTFVSGTTRAQVGFDWDELAKVRGTICVLMGMRRLDELTAGLLRTGRDPSTPAAVIQWGTRAEQRVVEGRLDEIAERATGEGLGSPGLVVIGAVTRLRRTLRWFDTRPLFGKRVLITRAEAQAAGTARAVRRRGAEAVEIPTIELVAPPDPARVERAVTELGGYDVVAFTSENGVAWFWRTLEAAGRDARALGRAKVAAVGPGTAAALTVRGVRADVVAREFRGEGLAEAILANAELAIREGRPRRALLPRALVARQVLPETLRAHGFEVDVVPVYETRAASGARRDELRALLEERRLDVVMLTASSTADNLCDLLGVDAAELLARTVVASIGPITSATAQKRGLRVDVTAPVHTIAGLLAALEEHFRGARDRGGSGR